MRRLRHPLGTRTIATLGYENDPDRTTVLAGFDTPRLIANRVGIGASYSRRSDGHAAGASLSYPFFSLSSGHGGSLSWGLLPQRNKSTVFTPRPTQTLLPPFPSDT